MQQFPVWKIGISLLWMLLSLGTGSSWGQALPDVFGYQQPERYLLKVDLVGLVQDRVNGVLYGQARLGFEQKLSPAWAGFGEVVSDLYWGRATGRPDPAFTITAEPRLYLFQAQDVRAGLRASNFSGNYITLSTSLRLRAPRVAWAPDARAGYLYPDRLAFAPLFGVQRRILTYGFADFRMGMEWRYRTTVAPLLSPGIDPQRGWQVGPVARLRLGLGI